MSSVAFIFNKECAACSKVEFKMVQIGSVIMCEGCFKKEFTTDDPVDLEREIYLKWLNIQNQNQKDIEKQNQECSKQSKAASSA